MDKITIRYELRKSIFFKKSIKNNISMYVAKTQQNVLFSNFTLQNECNAKYNFHFKNYTFHFE